MNDEKQGYNYALHRVTQTCTVVFEKTNQVMVYMEINFFSRIHSNPVD